MLFRGMGMKPMDDNDIKVIREFVAYWKIDHNIESLMQVPDVVLIAMCKQIINEW